MLNIFSKRLKKRLLHQICISSVMLLLSGIIYIILLNFYPVTDRIIFRLSLTTAYISVILLAATLTLGAWNIFRRHANPVSSDLRRDIGIWCGMFCLLHVLFGFNVHLQHWTQYFIDNSGKSLTDLFGVTNYLGVLATLIVIMLFATSNDFSLRLFRHERWKALQRWNYFFAILTVIHGFAYQSVENRLIPFGFIFGTFVLWTITVQIAGFFLQRRQASVLQNRLDG